MTIQRFADRCRQLSTTLGTGALTFDSTETGFQAISDEFSVSEDFAYGIEGLDGDGNLTGEWETGRAHLDGSGHMVRETVYASSNAGNLVDFTSFTLRAFVTINADGLDEWLSAHPSMHSSGVIVDNSIVRYDGNTGNVVQASGFSITDGGVMQAPSGSSPAYAFAADSTMGLFRAPDPAFPSAQALNIVGGTDKDIIIGDAAGTFVSVAGGSSGGFIIADTPTLWTDAAQLRAGFSVIPIGVTGDHYVQVLELTGGVTPTPFPATSMFYADPTAHRLKLSNNNGAFSDIIVRSDNPALGTGASTRVAFWSGANTLSSNANFTFSGTVLTVPDGGVNFAGDATAGFKYEDAFVLGTSGPTIEVGANGYWAATGTGALKEGAVFFTSTTNYVIITATDAVASLPGFLVDAFGTVVLSDQASPPAGVIGAATLASKTAAHRLQLSNNGAAYSDVIVRSDNPALGTGANTRVAVWSGANTISSDANFTWSSNLLTVNGRETITAGGLGSGQQALSVTGTLPSGDATSFGTNWVTTGSGNTATWQMGHFISLSAGYTGGGATITAQIFNGSAGTGNNPYDINNFFGGGNYAVNGLTQSSTSGANVGGWFAASGSSTRNVSLLGKAYDTATTGSMVAVAGAAVVASGVANRTAGLFFLTDNLSQYTPAIVSAAAIADNGNVAKPIQLWRDNGSVVMSIDDGGFLTLGTGSNRGDIFDIVQSQNAPLFVNVANLSNGNASRSGYGLESDNSEFVTWELHSSTWTTSGLSVPAQFFFNLGSTVTGGALFLAQANTAFRFVTNSDIPSSSSKERFTISGTEVVVNESGAAYNFRVESDNNTAMLLIDAANDRFGIGTSPTQFFHAQKNTNAAVLALWENQTSGSGGSIFNELKSGTTDGYFGAYSQGFSDATFANFLSFEVSSASGSGANGSSGRGGVLIYNGQGITKWLHHNGTSVDEHMRIDGTGQLMIGVNQGAPSHRVQIEGGTLGAAVQALRVTTTMNSNPSGSRSGVVFDITTNGSVGNSQYGAQLNLNPGYVGAAATYGMSFVNTAAGTGAADPFAGDPSVAWNVAAWGETAGNVAATNIGALFTGALGSVTYGFVGNAGNSAFGNNGFRQNSTNHGVLGAVTLAKHGSSTTEKHVGVVGAALNGDTNVGGYFGLIAAAPTYTSAALIANNGGTTSPIFIAQDNASAVVTIADGGDTTFTGQIIGKAGTTANTAFSTTGDPNTGMRFPAADTLALVTGGTDRVTVSSLVAVTGELSVSGAFDAAYAAVSTDTTLDATHFTVNVDSTAADKTITLPAASTKTGRIYVIVKAVAANNVIIDANGSETINGALTKTLTAQYETVWIQSDGSNWIIL